LRSLQIPLIDATVRAGIPEGANESFSKTALYNFLVKHPEHTYGLKAKGESMIGAGINDGDLMIVDRALKPRFDSILIFEIDNEYTVKHFEREDGHLFLVPANPDFERLQVKSHQLCNAWGVVTFVLKSTY